MGEGRGKVTCSRHESAHGVSVCRHTDTECTVGYIYHPMGSDGHCRRCKTTSF